MADVFISYHQESASDLLSRIAQKLKEQNVSCWYDKREQIIGNFDEKIVKAIENCKIFLLLFDDGANQSEWCVNETAVAFKSRPQPLRMPFQLGKFDIKAEWKLYLARCNIWEGGDSPETAHIDELIRGIFKELKPLKLQEPLEIIDHNRCGENNVEYTLHKDRVLTISGTGSMRDYAYSTERNSTDAPWWKRSPMISCIRIREGVTSIGSASFFFCKMLESVVIPGSVTFIGDLAFSGCERLRAVRIPHSVTSIGDMAFRDCAELVDIEIGDNVSDIGDGAFSHCNSLVSVRIPNRAIYMGRYAFDGCANLENVDIFKGVTCIRQKTFNGCARLSSVHIPDSVTEIGDSAFWGCANLPAITIPDSVKSIGDCAFWGCTSLTNVYIPDSVTEIGNSAFWNCDKLTTASVPKGLDTTNVFSDATALIYRE